MPHSGPPPHIATSLSAAVVRVNNPCHSSAALARPCDSDVDAFRSSRSAYSENPFAHTMLTATPVHDLLAIEKLRAQELEEARIIQSAMLPSRPLLVQQRKNAAGALFWLVNPTRTDGERGVRNNNVELEPLLLRGIPGRHSSLQYAIFYPATAEMVLSNAGMPGPFLLREHECRPL